MKGVLALAQSESWILGSGSPRRRQYFEKFGLSFSVQSHNLDEEQLASGVAPEKLAVFLAREKAESLKKLYPEDPRPLLCADTTVLLDGKILGQPRDVREASGFLKALSGRTHEVITGLCVKRNKKTVVRHEISKVKFSKLEPELIDFYLSTDEWMGVAGGYRIQESGEILVKEIHGSFSNVVGLPIRVFYEILATIYADT